MPRPMDARQIIASSERVCRTRDERNARKGEASARKTRITHKRSKDGHHTQAMADTRQITKAEGDKNDMTTTVAKKRAEHDELPWLQRKWRLQMHVGSPNLLRECQVQALLESLAGPNPRSLASTP